MIKSVFIIIAGALVFFGGYSAAANFTQISEAAAIYSKKIKKTAVSFGLAELNEEEKFIVFREEVLAASESLSGIDTAFPIEVEGSSLIAKIGENGVKEYLTDPFSAVFKDTVVAYDGRGNVRVCGKVNAKNGFGAYAGDQVFISKIDLDNTLRETSSTYVAFESVLLENRSKDDFLTWLGKRCSLRFVLNLI